MMKVAVYTALVIAAALFIYTLASIMIAAFQIFLITAGGLFLIWLLLRAFNLITKDSP